MEIKAERIKCKVCRIEKIRIHRGFFNPKSKIYTNDIGKYWSGFTCPECKTDQVKTSMRKLRAK